MLETNGSVSTISPHLRTKCGNGKRQHAARIDERTLWARRTREICEAVISDLGGIDRLSEAQKQLVRRLAGLSVVCEGIEVELAQGARPTGEHLQEYIAAINAARRVSHSVGLARVPKDITPVLETYLAERYSSDGDGSR